MTVLAEKSTLFPIRSRLTRPLSPLSLALIASRGAPDLCVAFLSPAENCQFSTKDQ